MICVEMRPAPRRAAKAATQIRNGKSAITRESATWLAMASPSLREYRAPASAMAARIERARGGRTVRRIADLEFLDRRTGRMMLRDPRP
jgi:hypothetical protein